jgi:hypothetical protein
MRAALALAVACLPAPGLAAIASASPIQAGAFVQTGSHPCTLGYVFDGVGGAAGREFISTAGHCVDGIGQHSLDGGGNTIGKVAFVGDLAAGPPGDFALIEVGISRVLSVRPYLRGHKTYPSGFTRASDTPDWDPIAISGYGDAYASDKERREQRTGRLRFDNAEEFNAVGPISTGDSGAPIAQIRSGNAIGTVSDLCFGAGSDCNAARGPTVEGMLGWTLHHGLPLKLRLADSPPPARVVIKAESLRRRMLHPVARVSVRPRAIRAGATATVHFRMRRRATVRLHLLRRVAGRWTSARTVVLLARRGENVVRVRRAADGKRLRPGRYEVRVRAAFGGAPVRARFVVRRRASAARR